MTFSEKEKFEQKWILMWARGEGRRAKGRWK